MCFTFSPPFPYSSAVAHVQNTCRVQTDRGRFRLLVRTCLVKSSLHFPVEMLVQHQSNWNTYKPTAILGDDILSQILLSVLLQCSKLKFALHLGNCLFLDETWMLAPFEKLEFVPCKELGLCVR
jgi:RUN domain